MVIKSLKIYSFGSIMNKEIILQKGLNLIYGENEKGKSTIEAFIKVMLYGFSTKKTNGISDRKRYLPFNGNSIKGEMLIESKGREYIIQRTFGKTKKNDTSKIIDALTGEVEKVFNNEEPGKSFMEISRETFEKTLYISQLGVSVEKDKEEEIMDKITSIFGCGENEIPIERALNKLENIQKTIVTARGIGNLDLMRKKRGNLLEEKYEGYKIAEKNIQWENELLLKKNISKELKKELNKLQVYKKYLKKISLQKEYKEISEYLVKSENLKNEEEKINRSLKDSLIDEKFIEELKEENIKYLEILDRFQEMNFRKEEIEKKLGEINREFEKYKFLDVFGDDLKEKLISLKYEQKTLEEKVRNLEQQKLKFKNLEIEKQQNINSIGKLINIESFQDEIDNSLKNYEKSLREVQFIMEKHSNGEVNLYNNKFVGKYKIFLGILSFIIGVLGAFLGYLFLKFSILFLGLFFVFIGGFIIFKGNEEIIKLKLWEETKKDLNKLNANIEELEKKLNKYAKNIGINNYKELISALKRYEVFIQEDNRISCKIKEIEKEIKEDNQHETVSKYNKNVEFLNSVKRLSNSYNIDEILKQVKKYDEIKERRELVLLDLNKSNDNSNRLKEEIRLKESKLKDKLQLMGLEKENLLDIEIHIKSYREKLRKHEEIKQSLHSIEETYKLLLKDRDIHAIKYELKSILSEDMNCSYKSQEEIELEEKKKNEELLECEKTIKDLENNINNRLIGKRNIIKIEEELNFIEDNINKEEKKLKAVTLALNILEESLNEIKREIGPEINEKILRNFQFLTEEKYKEVKLGEGYKMTVRSKNNDDLFQSGLLSNGALDQLYLSLRFAFIELIFKEDKYPIILDDAFVQYDDNRREKALMLLNSKIKGQGIVFTCQGIEKSILQKKEMNFKYIEI